MKQLTGIKKCKSGMRKHRAEIKRLEERIEELEKSAKYKMVQKGADFKHSLGSLELCPDFNNANMLTVNVNENFNRRHGIRLRRSSVKRLRNYLNDFLKTRESK